MSSLTENLGKLNDMPLHEFHNMCKAAGFMPVPLKNTEDSADMCKCSECENTFNVDECAGGYDHHDGWEMPAYTEFLCPNCTDGGCLDDFFYSDKKLQQLEKKDKEVNHE